MNQNEKRLCPFTRETCATTCMFHIVPNSSLCSLARSRAHAVEFSQSSRTRKELIRLGKAFCPVQPLPCYPSVGVVLHIPQRAYSLFLAQE